MSTQMLEMIHSERSEWAASVTVFKHAARTITADAIVISVISVFFTPFSPPIRQLAIERLKHHLLGAKHEISPSLSLATSPLGLRHDTAIRLFELLPDVTAIREVGAMALRAPHTPIILDPSTLMLHCIRNCWDSDNSDSENPKLAVVDMAHQDFASLATAALHDGKIVVAHLDAAWDDEAVEMVWSRMVVLRHRHVLHEPGELFRAIAFVTGRIHSTRDPEKAASHGGQGLNKLARHFSIIRCDFMLPYVSQLFEHTFVSVYDQSATGAACRTAMIDKHHRFRGRAGAGLHLTLQGHQEALHERQRQQGRQRQEYVSILGTISTMRVRLRTVLAEADQKRLQLIAHTVIDVYSELQGLLKRKNELDAAFDSEKHFGRP